MIQHDFKLACVTNKQNQFTNIVLETLGLQDACGIAIAGDILARKKPEPLPLLNTAEHFGISASDVNAADAAGLKILCISYGYNNGQDIRLTNPDLVIGSSAGLPNILQAAA